MTTLGKYELHEQLGKGGFGTVFRATDTSLNRVVALKVLHPQLMVDEEFISRFKKEARMLASLDHPNIVAIYELGDVDGRVFIAMRYLPGGNLQQVISKHGPLSYEKASSILKQVCEGLQASHDLGLVHRDIKPANILFDARGNVVISDFGLARAVQLSDTSSLGGPAGTPAYRAPELWRGKPPASPASDVYSLGCIFAEMITGKVLFNGGTPDEILTQHLIDGPAMPEKWPKNIPDGFPAMLMGVLNKDPAGRPRDAASFFAEITTINRAKPAPPVNDIGINDKQEKPVIAPDIASEPIKQPAPTVIPPATALKKAVRMGTGNNLVEVAPDLKMEFVRVPAGDFLMGSVAGAGVSVLGLEIPQHPVYLDEYWIGKYPVTVAQYLAFLAATHYKNPIAWKEQIGDTPSNYPVVNVSWMDAAEFCRWLGEKSGGWIKLPTEAQWEKAARGTDGWTYPWGNEPPDCSRANYLGCKGNLSPVGSHPSGASPYGALDMAGNVWEWVADWYGDYPSGKVTNPTGPTSGEYRVLRGGSWCYGSNVLRAAYRNGNYPSSSNLNYGFRCASPLSKEDDL